MWNIITNPTHFPSLVMNAREYLVILSLNQQTNIWVFIFQGHMFNHTVINFCCWWPSTNLCLAISRQSEEQFRISYIYGMATLRVRHSDTSPVVRGVIIPITSKTLIHVWGCSAFFSSVELYVNSDSCKDDFVKWTQKCKIEYNASATVCQISDFLINHKGLRWRVMISWIIVALPTNERPFCMKWPHICCPAKAIKTW